MVICLISRSIVRWRLVDENLKWKQQRYKSYHVKKIRFQLTCVPGDFLFADMFVITPLVTRPPGYSEVFETDAKSAWSFCMLSVRPDYLEIPEDDFEESASIDGFTCIALKEDAPDHLLSRTVDPDKRRWQHMTELRKKSMEQYVIERIVYHVNTNSRTNYVVYKYGYSSNENIEEPQNIFQAFHECLQVLEATTVHTY